MDINSCDYKRFGPSNHYENTNTMSFGDNVGGITNPMVVTVNRFEVCLWVCFFALFDGESEGEWVDSFLIFFLLAWLFDSLVVG